MYISHVQTGQIWKRHASQLHWKKGGWGSTYTNVFLARLLPAGRTRASKDNHHHHRPYRKPTVESKKKWEKKMHRGNVSTAKDNIYPLLPPSEVVLVSWKWWKATCRPIRYGQRRSCRWHCRIATHGSGRHARLGRFDTILDLRLHFRRCVRRFQQGPFFESCRVRHALYCMVYRYRHIGGIRDHRLP